MNLLEAWQSESSKQDETEYTPWADPGWLSWNDMSPEEGFCWFVASLVGMLKPELIIETGVGQGYVTRRVYAQLQEDQQLLCFESDPRLQDYLRKIKFFSQKNVHIASSPTPSAKDMSVANLTILDSNFGERYAELRLWRDNAQPRSVVIVHDCGNGHGPETGHGMLAASIKDLGLRGIFLKNPRGSFLGIK
jgi:methyltransferase family protein